MSLEQEFLNLDKKIQEILKKSTNTLTKNYKKTLEELREMVRKLYDSYDMEGKLTLNEMSKYDRLQKLDSHIKTSLTKLYSENNALTNATLANICKTTMDITIDSIQGKTIKSLIPIKKTLDINKTVNEKMAGLHWAERMGHHRNDVIYSVQKSLKEGLAQGSTYKQMSDRLKHELGGNVVKPMRIIRTEGARVYASTQQQSLNAISSKGLKMTKKWVSVRDERVRDMHMKMDGVVVPYEDDFILPDGVTTKMPHLSGYARHDIHCRCIITIDIAKNQDILNSGKVGDTDGHSTLKSIKNFDYSDDKKTKQLFDDFTKKYEDAKVEHAYVISKENKLYHIEGTSGTVNITLVGQDALNNAKIIHNHPNDIDYFGDCFSKEDFQFFFEHNIKQMDVCSGLGHFSMSYSGDELTQSKAHDIYTQAKVKVFDNAYKYDKIIEYEQLEIMEVLGNELNGFNFERIVK